MLTASCALQRRHCQPQQSTGDPRDNYPTRYFGTMLNACNRSFGTKKACITEIGYLTPEGYANCQPASVGRVTPSIAEQAQWLAEAAVLAATKRSRPPDDRLNSISRSGPANRRQVSLSTRADGTMPGVQTGLASVSSFSCPDLYTRCFVCGGASFVSIAFTGR